MKPHPRIRKTVKWGGAVVSVLLVVAWVGSGWWGVTRWLGNGYIVTVAGGQFRATRRLPINLWSRTGWAVSGDSLESFQWGGTWTRVGQGWFLGVPLWPFVVVPGFGSALAWRLDTLARRRARIGLCPQCSYNRAGLAPSAVCPECGSAAPVAGPPA